MAPIETAEKIIAEWTQQPCPPMLENNRPIVTVKARTQLLLPSMYQLMYLPQILQCCGNEDLPLTHCLMATVFLFSHREQGHERGIHRTHTKKAQHVPSSTGLLLWQVDPMDGLSGGYEASCEPYRQFGDPLSRIQSVDPAFEQAACSLEDTEKLKSLRVMDWIRGDLNLEPSPLPDADVVPSSSSPVNTPPLPTLVNRWEKKQS